MADWEWIHAALGVGGFAMGVGSTVFACGRWVGRAEERLKSEFKTALTESEKRIEEKVDEARTAFDETLRGLRQKVNDVEKDVVAKYLPREEFTDFRKEYREDMREIKASIAVIAQRQ